MPHVGAVLQTHWVSRLMRRLPSPVIALLDSWSSRIARRHAITRQRAWMRRKAAVAAAAAAAAQPQEPKLKPWRD